MPLANHKTAFRLSDQYLNLKTEIHKYLIRLIEERDINFDEWPERKLADFVNDQVRRYVIEKKLAVNQNEAQMLASDALDELIGFGPIQDLIDDDSVNDIVVNGPDKVFVEKNGVLSSVQTRFMNDAHVIRVIQRILAPLGRRVDESTPMVDARLPDGSRVNAIIPPLALDGPCISIRKFRKNPLRASDLLRYGSIDQAMLDYLRDQVENRVNAIVVGGTGSGKTTFLNLISQWIPDAERVVTVEDAAELRLENNHVVRLETRPPNLEGDRQVTARDLVRNALRMRPDRIIVGEVRGDEVLDMLQAMNTGHDGSMTTIHANNPEDAVHRLTLLAGFAGFTGSDRALLQQVSSAVQLFIHVSRLSDGKRRVMAIVRIDGMQGDQLALTPLFEYDPAKDSFNDLRRAAA